MDTILEKKKGLQKKHLPIVVGTILLLFALGWVIFSDHSLQMSVETDRLDIQTVMQGEFNDYIRINGQVQPINVVQISVSEAGMVVERNVEEGAMVQKGEIIVKLKNPILNLSILDGEAQLAEKQNFLRNTQVEMEQEKLNLRKEKLQLDLDVQRAERKYKQYEQLYFENLVSKEDYLQAKEDFEFAKDHRQLVVDRQIQDSIYRSIQILQMEESLQNIRENLELIRNRVDNLDVKAPISGQLGLLDVEIGQSVVNGERIGQINVLTDYKVEAQIDEHYIDRVKQGLGATFDRQDKSFALRVRKIFPEVRDKTFKTEFIFEGERPDNIRAGQTYYINLELGQPTKSIIIPKGNFYQTTGGRWIFVVSSDGTRAVRRDIAIGRQNPIYYEILSGLEPGEQVIVSGYETFGKNEELKLR